MKLRSFIKKVNATFDRSDARIPAILALLTSLFWWLFPAAKPHIEIISIQSFAVVSSFILWISQELKFRTKKHDPIDAVNTKKIMEFYDNEMRNFLRKHDFHNHFSHAMSSRIFIFLDEMKEPERTFSNKYIEKRKIETLKRGDELIEFFLYSDSVDSDRDGNILRISPEMYEIDEKHFKNLDLQVFSDESFHQRKDLERRRIVTAMNDCASEFSHHLSGLISVVRSEMPDAVISTNGAA